MQRIKTLLWMLTLARPLAPLAQETEFNLSFGKQRLVNVKGVMLGDSAFLTIDLQDYIGGPVTANKSYWLLRGGKSKPVDLPELTKKTVFNVAANNGKTYYYFLESKKRAEIGALVVSNTGEKSITIESLQLETKVYASYVEQGDLFLLTGRKGVRDLKLVQVRGLKVVNERIFPLSFDLSKNPKAAISFSRAGAPMLPSDAAAAIKITKEESAILISMDETIPITEYPDEDQAPKLYRTIAARLDLETGLMTNKVFMSPPVYFNSTIFNGHLYRLSQDKGFQVEIFDLRSGKKLQSYFLSNDIQHGTNPVYFRNGKTMTVSKSGWIGDKGAINSVIRSTKAGFISVDSTRSDSVIVVLGVRVEMGLDVWVPSFPSLGIVGVVVPAIARGLIHDLGERPEVFSYFYSEGTVPSGFATAYKANVIQHQIDEYEAKKATRYKIKGYLTNPSFTYGIYYVENSPTVEIVRFER